jgi:hypothetical protein
MGEKLVQSVQTKNFPDPLFSNPQRKHFIMTYTSQLASYNYRLANPLLIHFSGSLQSSIVRESPLWSQTGNARAQVGQRFISPLVLLNAFVLEILCARVCMHASRGEFCVYH